jgi:hypothetical protein
VAAAILEPTRLAALHKMQDDFAQKVEAEFNRMIERFANEN